MVPFDTKRINHLSKPDIVTAECVKRVWATCSALRSFLNTLTFDSFQKSPPGMSRAISSNGVFARTAAHQLSISAMMQILWQFGLELLMNQTHSSHRPIGGPIARSPGLTFKPTCPMRRPVYHHTGSQKAHPTEVKFRHRQPASCLTNFHAPCSR